MSTWRIPAGTPRRRRRRRRSVDGTSGYQLGRNPIPVGPLPIDTPRATHCTSRRRPTQLPCSAEDLLTINKQLRLLLAFGAGLALAATSASAAASRGQSDGARLSATKVAGSNHTDTAGHRGLPVGNGFVTNVATSDRWLTVKTTTGHRIELWATNKRLRRTIDAVSVTDYVTFTYALNGGRSELARLDDTSVSASGELTGLSRKRKLVTVRVARRGTLRLHASRAFLLAGLRVGDKVDVDYYRAADGKLVLVNIDIRGPGRPGGNGGGPAGGNGGGAGGGSAGSAGSGGPGGSAGSAGSAGSGGPGGSAGSAGSSGTAG